MDFLRREARRVQEHSHEVLVSGLADLDEVGLDAVHPLVDLSVVGRLFLQIFLQSAFAVYDFNNPGLQFLVIAHNPEINNDVFFKHDSTYYLLSLSRDMATCGVFLPLDLLVVAFSPELLDVLLAVPLLCLALLLKYLYGFIKRLDGRPLHLDFLEAEARYASERRAKHGGEGSGRRFGCGRYSLVKFWCILHTGGRTLCSSPGTAGGTRTASSPRPLCCLLSPPGPKKRNKKGQQVAVTLLELKQRSPRSWRRQAEVLPAGVWRPGTAA